ncbi:MAG: hypothetical protein HQL47_11560 [Gammaproteobacteria bacterium]|nr:hypothetical protein [Gammaproteobacteria bacterium]
MSEEAEQIAGLQATSWLLGLNAAQIQDALQAATGSMDELTGSVTELLQAVRQIDENAQISVAFTGLPEDSPLHRFDGRVLDYVQGVLTALQFYDRLSQRLEHVAEALTGIAGLVDEPARLDQAEAWRQLLDGISQRHSTPEEHCLFLQHLPQAPLRYAPPQAASEPSAGAGDIEFF